ncbi:MAG TPA: hypothetical protein VGM92_05820 [Candidatus Kapabacteria bacterium]|jgi:hypothetical protein
MKTKQILIVLFFVPAIIVPFVQAQTIREYGFGVGLMHSNHGEVIGFLARESPLRDIDVDKGDTIIALNGKGIANDNLFLLAHIFEQDSIQVVIARAKQNDTISATITKTSIRTRKVDRCGMSDASTGYVRINAFDENEVEMLEMQLDSLAKGETGYGTCTDTFLARQQEARAYAFRENGYVVPVSDPFGLRDPIGDFRATMDSYIVNKYGWQMATLVVDMHGSNAPSKEVMRCIRLFGKEKNIILMSEF